MHDSRRGTIIARIERKRYRQAVDFVRKEIRDISEEIGSGTQKEWLTSLDYWGNQLEELRRHRSDVMSGFDIKNEQDKNLVRALIRVFILQISLFVTGTTEYLFKPKKSIKDWEVFRDLEIVLPGLQLGNIPSVIPKELAETYRGLRVYLYFDNISNGNIDYPISLLDRLIGSCWDKMVKAHLINIVKEEIFRREEGDDVKMLNVPTILGSSNSIYFASEPAPLENTKSKHRLLLHMLNYLENTEIGKSYKKEKKSKIHFKHVSIFNDLKSALKEFVDKPCHEKIDSLTQEIGGSNDQQKITWPLELNKLIDMFLLMLNRGFIEKTSKEILKVWIIENFQQKRENIEVPLSEITVGDYLYRKEYGCKNPVMEIRGNRFRVISKD